jgi:FkbM family methyltransferase
MTISNDLKDAAICFWRGTTLSWAIATKGKAINGDFYVFGMPSLFEGLSADEQVTYVDVGGHLGDTVSWVLKNEPRVVDVLVFEPGLSSYKELSGRFLGESRVVVSNLALGHETRSSMFYVFDHKGLSSLYQRGSERYEHDIGKPLEAQPVEVEALDEYYHKISGSIVVKIDAQGAEFGVLKGMKKFLSSGRVRALMVECSVKEFYAGGSNPSYIVRYLMDYGFQIGHITYGYRAKDGLNAEYDVVFQQMPA